MAEEKEGDGGLVEFTPEQLKQFEENVKANTERSGVARDPNAFGSRAVTIPDSTSGFSDFQAGDIASAIQNAPDILRDNLQMAKAMVTSTDPAKEILSFLAGVPGDVFVRGGPVALDGKPSNKTQLMFQDLKESLIDNPRKTFVENGDEILGLLIGGPSGVARGLGKKTVGQSIGNQVRRGLKGVANSPLSRPVSLAYNGTAESLKSLVTWLPTYPTGVDARAFRLAYESGRGGKNSSAYKSFKNAQRNVNDDQVEGLADTLVKQASELKEEAANAYKSDLAKITLKEELSTEEMLTDVTKKLFDDHNLRFKVGINEKGATDINVLFGPRKHKQATEVGSTMELLKSDQTTIQELIGHLLEVHKRGNNSIEAMHNLRRNLDNVVYSARLTGETQAEAAAKTVREVVRKQLSERVDGYDAAMKGYQEAADFLEEMSDAFVTSGKKETIMGTMTRVLERRPNKERQQRILKALDAKFGGNLEEAIAGISTADLVGKGLVGRAAGASAVLNPEFLTLLPFTMPRVMGSFFAGLGVKFNQAEKALKRIWDEAEKRPGLVTEGLSYFEVSQRLQMSDAELEVLQQEDEAKKNIEQALKDKGLPNLMSQGGSGAQEVLQRSGR